MNGLAGKRVLLARPEGQSESAAQALRERGATPVIIPSIAVGPPDDPARLHAAVDALDAYDWVVLTSVNGVAALGSAVAVVAAAKPKFAVVGAATRAALEALGVAPALVAKEFRAEALASDLVLQLPVGTSPRVLYLRAQEGSDVLPDVLREAGARVDVVAAYQTSPSLEGAAEIARRLRAGTLDVVIFSSGSTVDAIVTALGDDAVPLLSSTIVACLGPVTLAAATARGVRVDVTPDVATFLSLIDALDQYLRGI